MIDNPKVGDRVWSIAPSTESQCYGNADAHEPWLAQVVKETGHGDFRICAVCSDGTLDDDSNASAYVHKADLHATRREALIAYVATLGNEIEALKDEIKVKVDRREKSMVEICPRGESIQIPARGQRVVDTNDNREGFVVSYRDNGIMWLEVEFDNGDRIVRGYSHFKPTGDAPEYITITRGHSR